jgi:DtxR family transcriptional regulator, Mn-dependent transcriptional regulator
LRRHLLPPLSLLFCGRIQNGSVLYEDLVVEKGKGIETMNQDSTGLPLRQGKSSQQGIETREKSEIQQREEVLEFIWTMREAGKKRLPEILANCPEEGIEEILKGLEQDGWIAMQEGEVNFLEEGEKRGQEVIRRHRLAERLLSEAFALPERDFESSACQFEHILSPQVLESVCSFLGHPPVCPHGKPIPPGPCCARFKREVEPLVRPLPDLKLGEEGRVVFITPKSKGRLERLSSMGLIPGSVIRLAQKRPAYVIEIGETTLALDEEVAKEIYMKRT